MLFLRVLTKVKIDSISKVVMGIKKFIWGKKTNRWEENTSIFLGKEVCFRLLITSTLVTPLDTSIVDTLPDDLVFSNNATVTPLKVTLQQIE